jgi:hypothetical protein
VRDRAFETRQGFEPCPPGVTRRMRRPIRFLTMEGLRNPRLLSRPLAARAIVCLFAACSSPSRSAPPRDGSGIVPIVRARGLLYVEIGKPGEPALLALVDTGASASAIDPRRAADLPAVATSEVVGTTGSLQVENVELKGLGLGALELPPLRATRRDLSGLLSPDGRPVDLILGSDAFVGRALTIDFGARTLELSSGAPESGADDVPMALDNGIPAIPATIGGIATTLRIDTGASLFETSDVYVNVPPRLWSALRALDPALEPTTHFQGTGANGESVQLPVAPVRGARIGPKDLDAVFVIVQPEAGYFADPAARGFVGNNFLGKLGRVTLDYGRGRFRITAGSSSRSSTSSAGTPRSRGSDPHGYPAA